MACLELAQGQWRDTCQSSAWFAHGAVASPMMTQIRQMLAERPSARGLAFGCLTGDSQQWDASHALIELIRPIAPNRSSTGP